MLVLLGGRERGAEQWSALAGRAGLRIVDTIRRPHDVTMLDCVPTGKAVR
jgi:hypothetical protein